MNEQGWLVTYCVVNVSANLTGAKLQLGLCIGNNSNQYLMPSSDSVYSFFPKVEKSHRAVIMQLKDTFNASK